MLEGDFLIKCSLLTLLSVQFPPIWGQFIFQACQKTKWQAFRNHGCPTFPVHYREAATLEKLHPNGTITYMKLCCYGEALELNKAAAKSCQTTRCVLPSEPFNGSNYPCSTMAKIIVDGRYIVNEESLRDDCLDEKSGKWGVAAVCCPPNSMASLLISAYGAELNEFPHQARLQSGNEVCGGTVYNKDYIVTAAHCVTEKTGMVKEANETFVVLGTNIATLDSKTNVFPVKRIVVHEGFSLRWGNHEFHRLPILPKRIFNDVAVLELERSIDFEKQPHIRALPIPPPNFKPADYADQVVIVGWGTTDNGLTTQHLQKANLIIRQDEQCFKGLLGGGPYANTKDFSNQLLCVGGVLNGQFSPVAGRGDSGGPAICRGADGYAVHCGITSFGGDGDSCSKNVDESSCRPSAYADVSFFRDWIIKHAGVQRDKDLLKVKLFGDPVPDGHYEHQVHITTRNGPPCGGTLISPDTLVTAAHCVFTDDKKAKQDVIITIRDGSTFVPRSGGMYRTSYFERYNLLERLNHRKSGKKSYLNPPYVDDIAVIKLTKNVPVSPDKLPKLPKKGQVPHKNIHALELSIPLTNKRGNMKLSQRKFRILDPQECQRRLDRFKIMGVEARFDTQKIFCGVEEYSGGGICDRETGGGLICKSMSQQGESLWRDDFQEERDGQQILCGIQSFRLCDMSMPMGFINVGKYIDMIEGIMKRK